MTRKALYASIMMAPLLAPNVYAKTLADTLTETITYYGMIGPESCGSLVSFKQSNGIVLDTETKLATFDNYSTTALYRSFLSATKEASVSWHNHYAGALTLGYTYMPELSGIATPNTKVYASFYGTIVTKRVGREIKGRFSLKGVTPVDGGETITCYAKFKYSGALSNPIGISSESTQNEASTLSTLKGKIINNPPLNPSSTGSRHATRTYSIGVRG